MIVLDSTLLSDYLDGRDAAREFLDAHESEAWAVSAIVLYEAQMGAVHGSLDADPQTLTQAITTAMDVLPVTERTAAEATALQEALLERGLPADHPDALIAASAREHGARFATAERHFWDDDVQSVLSVAPYDPRAD
ncbi:PIN domain-containing protein [Halococcoides cellulosivorans]|uniref:Sugar metabolism cluster protein n=1 Tax=Halococcoides cellulosivorans TaxID=1679096 RepID=A0A2R4X012_9EURY|nr:PIN domain-containing protein [Halococcoides cellulosivorans]AWB27128.1 sugar metabolism cluster protein [Halococcoides cellulosivorans]